LVEPNGVNLVYHLAIYLGLTLLYVSGLHILKQVAALEGAEFRPKRYLCFVIAVWLVCAALLFGMAPGGESHDIFDYIFRGRMMTELSANPLAETPKHFDKTPYYRYVAWHSHVDTYGPLWEMTSAAVAYGVRDSLQRMGWWDVNAPSCPRSPLSCRMLIGYLSGYRLLAVGLSAFSGWLIVSMVARREDPALAMVALAAWLWNPLLLIATAVGAHNDALMLVLLLSSLWLLQRACWLPGLLVFVLAAHVKLSVLILTPLLGLWLVRRRGWLRAVGYGVATTALGLLLSWLLYQPFAGWGTLPRMLYERSLFLANSPWQALHYLLYTKYVWPYAAVWRLTVQMPTWLFALCAILTAAWMLDFRPRRWQLAPSPDWRDDRWLWRAATVTTLFYLLIGSFWFQHWYVVWALAPASLLPTSRLSRFVLPWLASGALAANVVSNFLLTTSEKGTDRMDIYLLVITLIWMPALLASIAAHVSVASIIHFISTRNRSDATAIT
jgi:hypothetical protein